MPKRAFSSPLSLSFIFLVGADCRSAGDDRQQPKSEATRPGEAIWHATRTSPLDLELSGDLVGLAAGAKRYVSRQDLLALPQVNFTVTDDLNFDGATGVRGFEVELLARTFAAEGAKALVVATCVDLMAASAPSKFAAYVRNPRGKAQYAEMPAYPNYHDATLQALTSYFPTFDPAKRP
jgi:hypothetical protein